MYKILALSCILLLSAGCISPTEDVKTNSLNGNWNKNSEQQFEFEVTEAQNPKNIIFVVRNNNTYPYSNIRFIVNLTNLRNKKKETDTVNYTLAKPNGAWIGTGFGKTKEIHFQYKTDYKFPENGKYSIGITQAMRNDNLPGIEDIGVKIETKKP